MNKKLIILFVLIGVISSVTIYTFASGTLKQGPDLTIPSNDDDDKEDSSHMKETQVQEYESEDDNDEDEPITDQFKDFITDAVQSTIDFFRHKELQIVAVGDSLTQGVGDETDQGGYVGLLDQTIKENEQKTSVTFENFGKRGNRTDQLLTRLDEPEIQEAISNADMILITIGANDIMQVFKENFTNLTIEPFQEERRQVEHRLNNIFAKIRDRNTDAHIYLLGIYNPFKQYFEDIEELEMIVSEWNRTSHMITRQYDQATFIPIKDLFENTDVDLFAEDNFHPNTRGYERMASRVLEYLTDQEE